MLSANDTNDDGDTQKMHTDNGAPAKATVDKRTPADSHGITMDDADMMNMDAGFMEEEEEELASQPSTSPKKPVSAAMIVDPALNADDKMQVEELKLDTAQEIAEASFDTLLRIFYQRLFPFKLMHRWLNYGNVQKNYFINREFSFTLASDAYIRFQSFKDAEELKSEILKLSPVKIDIGAVYNAKPKDRKMLRAGAFQPIERELVFDIDMTDYDPIRSCCSDAKICMKCWEFMTISIKIIDRSLEEDFGFKHRLWIYSGRRGVHCWVCDDRARKLTAEARRAIVNYLEVVKGGEDTAKKVSLSRKSREILEKHFLKGIIINQDILRAPEMWNKLIALIPDEEVQTTLRDHWTKHDNVDPDEKWENIVDQVQEAVRVQKNSAKKQALNQCLDEIMFQYSYPRLDSNVSIGLNHLLKSPFCIHPKTGSVCVPIDPYKCDEFNPLEAPKLAEIIEELNTFSAGRTDAMEEEVADFMKTSLRPHIEYFQQFLQKIDMEVKETLRQRRVEEDKKMAF
ncbi:primase, DNA, polypeptide 1 (49kDa) [Chytridiales sp. JEL 0842]|nr:primase, DNA, polypeptide 1 (49kDa) [Chytridiales sp. JEL 0842]